LAVGLVLGTTVVIVGLVGLVVAVVVVVLGLLRVQELRGRDILAVEIAVQALAAAVAPVLLGLHRIR